MAKKDKPINNPGIKDIMMGVRTATTKTAPKVVEVSSQENSIETNTTGTEPTIISSEVNEEQSPGTIIEHISKNEADEDISNEIATEAIVEETPSLPKKLQVNMNEEDLKALNHAVSKTGLKRTKLVNQMIQFSLACKDDFIKYYSEKSKEPSISSIIKENEGRPKFCVQSVKKSRKDNFLLISTSELIDKADTLATELNISRNKFINEAILFALESM